LCDPKYPEYDNTGLQFPEDTTTTETASRSRDEATIALTLFLKMDAPLKTTDLIV